MSPAQVTCLFVTTPSQEHEELGIPETDDELADADASRAGKKPTDKGKGRENSGKASHKDCVITLAK